MFKPKERRIGKVTCSAEVLRDIQMMHPELYGELYIVKAGPSDKRPGCIEYTCYCDKFDVVAEEDPIPEYNFSISKHMKEIKGMKESVKGVNVFFEIFFRRADA